MKLAQRSTSSNPHSKARGAISFPFQSPTSSSHGEAQSNAALYDFPSSDEDDSPTANTPDIRSRKRRKITPTNDQPLTCVVYDDESLQRHIAAEMRMESSSTMKEIGEATATCTMPSTFICGRNKVSKQKEFSPIKTEGSTSRDRPDLNASCSYKDPESRNSPTKRAGPSNLQDNRVPVQKCASYKVQGMRERSAQPTGDLQELLRSNVLPALSAIDRYEGKQPHTEQDLIEQDFTQSSPPRSSAAVVTTPKQRKLWGKLLYHETQSESPSNLNLPGLRIADRKISPERPASRSRMQTGGRVASQDTGTRSARLIDSLITSERDRTPFACELSEENESSGTDESKSNHSKVSINDDILTTQTSPSAGSQCRRRPFNESGSVPKLQPVSTLQGAPKFTYIRERTHLGDDDLSDAAMLGVPLATDLGFPRKRYEGALDVTQPNHDSGTTVCDSLDDAQDSRGGAMRSVHELREAGGNTRIIGELESILDDLDERLDSSVSGRRSSLMSLTSKLQEASTCRMLVDQGLEPRLLAQAIFGNDIIERSLLAAAILQVLFHTASATFFSQTNRVRTTTLLVGLLGHTEDLAKQAKLREANMSKVGQSEYSVLCSAFLRSPVWRSLKPPVLSGQILALQGLELLVRQAREAGYLAEILSADAVSRIVQTAIPPMKASQPPTPSSRICLDLAVSILESSTISGAADSQIFEWTDTTFERIRGVFPAIADAGGHEFGSLRTLTLRLYLNLTNTNPQLCETFSKPPLLRAISKSLCVQFNRLSEPENGHQDSSLLDNLILSLGCLINLAESSDTMRQLILDLRTPEAGFLETLLQLFLKKRGKVAEVGSCLLTILSISLTIQGLVGGGGWKKRRIWILVCATQLSLHEWYRQSIRGRSHRRA